MGVCVFCLSIYSLLCSLFHTETSFAVVTCWESKQAKQSGMEEEYSVDDPTQLLQEASDFALDPGTHYLFFFFFFDAFHFLLNSLIFIIVIWLIFRCSKRCFSEGLPRPLPSSSHNKVIFIPLQISPHIYLYVFVELKLAIDYFCIYVFMYYWGSLCA